MERKAWNLDTGTGRVVLVLGRDVAEGEKRGYAGQFDAGYARWCEKASESAALLQAYAAVCARPGAKPITRADLASPDVKKQLRQAIDRGALVVLEGEAPAAPRRAPLPDEKVKGGVPATKLTVHPVLDLSASVVLVKKSYTKPKRVKIELTTDTDFDGLGKLTVTPAKGPLRFFDAATEGKAVSLAKGTYEIDFSKLKTVSLYAEGASPSASNKDIKLTLELSGGTKIIGKPAVAVMTSVELTLDVCKSRTSKDTPPKALSTDDKIKKGRAVHLQDGGRHHGRARLVIHRAEPADFDGKLAIEAIDARLRLFEVEVADPTQTSDARSLTLLNTKIDPAAGETRWAEGALVSKGLLDTGFRLGLDGGDMEGDRVAMTVVKLSAIKATIPASHSKRAGVVQLVDDEFTAGTKIQNKAFVAVTDGEYDEKALPTFMTLISGSVPTSRPIALAVTVTPKDAPVSWFVARHLADPSDPNDGEDHADVKRMGDAVPKLGHGKTPLDATLLSNAVGLFHVWAYVDGNGSGKYEYTVDREPFSVLNLVLIRAWIEDKTATYGKGLARSAFTVDTGLGEMVFKTGEFLTRSDPKYAGLTGAKLEAALTADIGVAAISFASDMALAGGGADGTFGTPYVRQGWANNQVGTSKRTRAIHTNPSNEKDVMSVGTVLDSYPASTPIGSYGAMRLLDDASPPVPVATPLLDATPSNSVDDGAGHILLSGLILPTLSARADYGVDVKGVISTDAPKDFGRLTFQGRDLTRFEMHTAFRAYLVVWTFHAPRLYAVLAEVPWKIDSAWDVTVAFGRATAVIDAASNVTTSAATVHSPSVTAETTSIEVRPPFALDVAAKMVV